MIKLSRQWGKRGPCRRLGLFSNFDGSDEFSEITPIVMVPSGITVLKKVCGPKDDVGKLGLFVFLLACGPRKNWSGPT